MQLDTLIFNASACGFPKPRIPLLPTGLDGVSFKFRTTWAPAENFRHFTRGRYALREAYRLAGIGPGSALLAPAYHCRTMLDPALSLADNVLLYPLQPNLSPNLDALDVLANQSPVPVKALLATHFFGFPQDFSALAAWCEARSITLVEDASHALLCEHHRPTGIGLSGSFVVSSPYKFLPSPDGGLLYARQSDRLHDLQQRQPPWLAELRGIANASSKAVKHRRNRDTCDPNRIDTELAEIIEHPLPAAEDILVHAECSADYRRADESCTALRYSQMIYHHPNINLIANSRCENYRRWVTATMNLPYCRPMFPELPAGCIPYMFPLLIAQPETYFYRLKHLGVPIWRWDNIAASGCATANNYRLHLLHLPCHQSLVGNELDWMIAAVEKVSTYETASDRP